jgi:transcriptional regulator with XRE-family HTH domain
MKLTLELPDAVILAELGRRLATRRLAARHTQAGLAARAGIAKRSVERLESGRPVELRTLVAAMRALGCGAGLDALVAALPAASPVRRRVVSRRPRERPDGR